MTMGTPPRQPVPVVGEADVLRVIRRDYGGQGVEWIMQLLSGYTCNEPYRVRLAILKAAKGNHLRIADLVREATSDYRDVLVAAKYGRYCKLGFDATDDQKRRAIQEDWTEYRAWLGRSADPLNKRSCSPEIRGRHLAQ